MNIRVHGWFGEDVPYCGKGVDITEWLDSVDDETVYRAAYTFEKSLVEEYQVTPVLVNFEVIVRPFDVLSIVGAGSRKICVLMELNDRQLAAYIRYNRPAVRDRLNYCSCAARDGAKVCFCDATVGVLGQVCEACLFELHNLELAAK